MTTRFAHGTPIYRTADVRALETAAAPAPPPLMERAGLAAAEIAREVSGGNGKPVLVLAGPGNNGGDAFVAARHLKQWYFDVRVLFAGDESKLSADATAALKAWRAVGGSIADALPGAREWGLVVDGIFGIGLEREVAGRHAEWIAAVNGLGALRQHVLNEAACGDQHVVGMAKFDEFPQGLARHERERTAGELERINVGAHSLQDVRQIAFAQGAVIGSTDFR